MEAHAKQHQPTSTARGRLLASVEAALARSAAARSVDGRVRLEVMFSVPRQARELFPYAHYDAQDASRTSRMHSIEAYVEHVFMTASYEASTEAVEGQPGGSRLMYALECFLYTLPKHRSAVLYVSKLDSSGWGPTNVAKHLQPYLSRQPDQASSSSSAPLYASTSITRVITEAFLRHFASLDHWNGEDDRLPQVDHLSLHILARAQGAYLFPSSNENGRKHILTDGQLIKWWRSVVTSVIGMAKGARMDVRPFYIVPGYDRLESSTLLPLPPAGSDWMYGHPYSHRGAGLPADAPLPPLPLSGPAFGGSAALAASSTFPPLFRTDHIATLMPYFPDDPKGRFLVEIAQAAHEHGGGGMANAVPPHKRRAVAPVVANTAIATPIEPRPVRSTRASTPSTRRSATPSTPPPSANRLRSGSRSGTASPSPVKLTSTQRQGMRERAALDQVSADEFWDRMAFRQECCSGNAVGVFVALFTRRQDADAGQDGLPTANLLLSTPQSMSRTSSATGQNGNATTGRSMAAQPLALPHTILQDIIFKRMMVDDCDWSKAQLSIELTRNWEQALGQALLRKGNLRATLGEEAAERQMALEPRMVGEGVVWSQVDLHGPTADEVREAEQKWREAGGNEAALATAAAPTINVLSVKRKKKPVT